MLDSGQLQKAVTLARRGDTSMIVSDVRRWVRSDTESVGFCRDFTIRHEAPEARLDLRAEPLTGELARAVFDEPLLEGRDRLNLERRHAIWAQGFEGGWAAVDPSGRPAYLQFYIPHSQLRMVKSRWGPLFPDYGPDTVLVEGAWTTPEFRGQRLMAQAMNVTSEAAAQATGFRYAVTYVEMANKGAQKGCLGAGYQVRDYRTESWRFGKQTVRFTAPQDRELL